MLDYHLFLQKLPLCTDSKHSKHSKQGSTFNILQLIGFICINS